MINAEACDGVEGISRYLNSLSTSNRQQSQELQILRMPTRT